MVSTVQIWNPDDWELFSFNLLQYRHGSLNVHKVPSDHSGDLGIDYYCIKDSVAYQCYAVEEPVDISTRAERQKKKITKDLNKIKCNHVEISKLFLGSSIKHWMLLVPNHDSKEVNLHCSKKTQDMRIAACPALDVAFEVGIQDLNSFPRDVVEGGISTISCVKLSTQNLSQQDIDNWTAGSLDLLNNAKHKLIKRTGPEHLDEAVEHATKSFLQGNALLDTLRNGSPDLHEKIMSAISSRARRLQFAGPQGGPTPGVILSTELDSLIAAMKTAAPNLSNETAEEIAYGAISEWIMRCPLDFPNV